MSNDLTKKRGRHYTIGADKRTLTVDLREAGTPQHSFSANWTGVHRDNVGCISLLFGQRAPLATSQRVYGLLQVRLSIERLEEVLQQSDEFLRSLMANEEEARRFKDLASEPLRTDPDRFLLEDANLIRMAYSGEQAELAFYQIPPHDVAMALRNRNDEGYVGPRAIVSVTLSRAELIALMVALGKELSDAR